MASAIQNEIGGPGGRAGGERLAVVCNTGGSPERELTYLTLLQRQRAAAVVLTGGAIEDPAHLTAVGNKLRRLADAGTPLTPRVQGASRDIASGVNGALRADLTGNDVTLSDPTIDHFFNTSAFGIPATGAFGTGRLTAKFPRFTPLHRA